MYGDGGFEAATEPSELVNSCCCMSVPSVIHSIKPSKHVIDTTFVIFLGARDVIIICFGITGCPSSGGRPASLKIGK